MGNWSGRVLEFQRVLLSWKWPARPPSPAPERGKLEEGADPKDPARMPARMGLRHPEVGWFHDSALPSLPVWRVALAFAAVTWPRAWGGSSFRGGTARPVWRNGNSRRLSQETWDPATCSVWPRAHPLTPLCLMVISSSVAWG